MTMKSRLHETSAFNFDRNSRMEFSSFSSKIHEIKTFFLLSSNSI